MAAEGTPSYRRGRVRRAPRPAAEHHAAPATGRPTDRRRLLERGGRGATRHLGTNGEGAHGRPPAKAPRGEATPDTDGVSGVDRRGPARAADSEPALSRQGGRSHAPAGRVRRATRGGACSGCRRRGFWAAPAFPPFAGPP